MTTNNTKSIKSTTIRISQETKNQIENLDFVKKHTFDEIIIELIKNYEKRGKNKV